MNRRATWLLLGAACLFEPSEACGNSSSARPLAPARQDGAAPDAADGSSASSGDGGAPGSATPGDASSAPDAPTEAGPAPAAVCTPPVALADTAHPTMVVGTGTASTCTEAALRTAVTAGGVITFNCGGQATIAVASELTVPTDRDTVIDGGGIQVGISCPATDQTGATRANPCTLGALELP